MIENNVCSITYPHGRMNLYMPKFFPAPNSVVRKLFRSVISLNYEDRCQIAQDILEWLKNSLNELDADAVLVCCANECVNARTLAKEMQPDIDRQEAQIQKMKIYLEEMPKGKVKTAYRAKIQEENKKLKELKEKQKSYVGYSKFYNGEFIKMQAKVKKFKGNIELIEQMTEGWF